MKQDKEVPDFFWHFDFDGTLFDTEAALISSYSEAVSRKNGMWTNLASKSLGRGESAEEFLKLCQWGTSGFDGEEIRKIKEINYAKMVSKIVPCVDLIKLAISLKPNVGLVTSSSRNSVDSILNHFNLNSYFSSIVSREDVKAVKPSPELYLVSVKRNPARVHIAVEDSEVGQKSATSAGLLTLMVHRKNFSEETFIG